MKRRLLLSLLALLAPPQAVPAALAQSAANFPNTSIQMVVGFEPGGTTDLFARVLSSTLSKQMGVPVVVENKSGANGDVATVQVAHAKPNGYTLLFGTASMVQNPALGMKSAADALAGLTPIARVSTGAVMLVANKDLPIKNIKDFVEYVKARPGQLKYGSGGIGNISHLVDALFLRRMGLSAIHVPFKGGTPARASVMSGEISFSMDSVGAMVGPVEGGQLRGLAVSSLNRSSVAPDIPTINETVAPGFEGVSWYGVMAPAGTPPDIVQKLYSQISTALKSQDLKTGLAKSGVDISDLNPQDFGAFIKKDGAQWKDVIEAEGIKAGD